MRTMLLTSMILLTCCGGPWSAARRQGTAEAYKRFVVQYPDHPKVDKARERAEELDWQAALGTDTSSSYALYIVAHPSGVHVEEARQRGEAKAWTEARTQATLAGYEAYLAAYPSGAHAAEAEAAVEDLVVEEARYADSADAWGRYLVRYPQGRFVEEALEKRDARGWERATQANTPDAYRAYLERHPKGSHRDEARAWLASLAIHTLQPVLVVGATWRPPYRQSRDRQNLVWQLENGLLEDARTRFEVRPLRVEDAVSGDLAHPADRHGRTPGVGLFVVEVSEEVGRTFEPSGHATRLPTTVSVYAAPTDEPLWTWSFTAATPETLYGSTEESLYTEAVSDWGSLMRGAPVPVDRLLQPEVP